MAVEFSRIKTISRSVKYSVNGYIRRCQKLLPSDNPYFDLHAYEIIISHILLFYDEPDVFEINGKSFFDYKKAVHHQAYHVFGKRIIKRGNINNYKWKIEASEGFSGRLGVIDTTKIKEIKDGHYFYNDSRLKSATAFCGSAADGWNGGIFGAESLNGNNMIPPDGDVITIDLDWITNKITITSKATNKIASGDIKPELKAVKFIAEFGFHDSSISIK